MRMITAVMTVYQETSPFFQLKFSAMNILSWGRSIEGYRQKYFIRPQDVLSSCISDQRKTDAPKYTGRYAGEKHSVMRWLLTGGQLNI